MRFPIVIAGGGAGGLELAARLGRKLRRRGPDAVLLLDRTIAHIWKPTLHEVAAGTLDIHQEGLLYPVLARRNRFSFAIGDVVGIDPAHRVVTLAPVLDEDGSTLVEAREVEYGQLVLALGCGTNAFNTPGIEHAHILESAHDAEAFRRRLLASFTRHAFTLRTPLCIAIVGGGATGVELSAELVEAHASFVQSIGAGFQFPFEVAIVEAGPRILGGLPEKMSTRATRALIAKGVRVMVGAKVTAIAPGTVSTSAGDVPADLAVWAAGIKAPEAHAGFGLAVNRINQFVVDRSLRSSADGVFALGDNAACPWLEHADVPARAQAAHQEAEWLLPRLVAALDGKPVPGGGFEYRDFGSLVSLGANRGVGNLMGGLGGAHFFVEGLIAKTMYMSLHLMHHRAILGTFQTIVLALARLLQRRTSGRLKLH